MLKIALTGGIASGKSVVCQLLKKRNVPIIDLDELAKKVVLPGSLGLKELMATFGEGVLGNDRTLNRKILREKLLENQDNKKTIEAILHPKILALMHQEIKRLSGQKYPAVLIVVPLLVEANLTSLFDKIIVVDCPEVAQKSRLKKRDNIDEAVADKILKNQSSRTERLAIKNAIIIDNSGSLLVLKKQVKQLRLF